MQKQKLSPRVLTRVFTLLTTIINFSLKRFSPTPATTNRLFACVRYNTGSAPLNVKKPRMMLLSMFLMDFCCYYFRSRVAVKDGRRRELWNQWFSRFTCTIIHARLTQQLKQPITDGKAGKPTHKPTTFRQTWLLTPWLALFVGWKMEFKQIGIYHSYHVLVETSIWQNSALPHYCFEMELSFFGFSFYWKQLTVMNRQNPSIIGRPTSLLEDRDWPSRAEARNSCTHKSLKVR